MSEFYEETSAHQVDIQLTVVTQPGQDPSNLYSRVMDAVHGVAGEGAGVTFKEALNNGQATYRRLYRARDQR